MALLQGVNLRIKVGTKTLFHSVTASFSSQMDLKEVSSKDTNGKIKTPGSNSWSLSCNKLISANGDTTTQADAEELMGYHINKTLVDVEFTTGDSGEWILSGQAYISSFTINANNDEEVTGDFSFEGSGDLTLATNA